MKKAIIVANGKPPKKKEILWFRKNGYNFIIAADGGANSLLRLDIIPDIIIGDLDSLNDNARKYFEGKTTIKKIKRQNDTDVEKAIKFSISKKFTDIVLFSASGDRLDHTLCNIGNLLKYADKINISMMHEKTIARVYTGNVKIKTKIGETVSFYAFSEKTLISTKGLKYKLQNEPLPFGQRSSTSNVATAEEIEISVSEGKIIVIREFSVIKKNDFVHNI